MKESTTLFLAGAVLTVLIVAADAGQAAACATLVILVIGLSKTLAGK